MEELMCLILFILCLYVCCQPLLGISNIVFYQRLCICIFQYLVNKSFLENKTKHLLMCQYVRLTSDDPCHVNKSQDCFNINVYLFSLNIYNKS